MSINVGDRAKLDRHIWKVDRVDGNYCYVSWNGHQKTVPLGTIEAHLVDPSTIKINKRSPPKPSDEVTIALSKCITVDQLISEVHSTFALVLTKDQLINLENLPNFGMCRMYVGNIIRREQHPQP